MSVPGEDKARMVRTGDHICWEVTPEIDAAEAFMEEYQRCRIGFAVEPLVLETVPAGFGEHVV